MYGCDTWATTKYLLSRLDAFDTYALRKVLRIPYTRHVSNVEVRRTTGCSPLSHLVTNRRLRLFTIEPLQRVSDKYRPTGSDQQISHTWLRAIEADLGPLNFGLATAWRKATILETNGDILWTQQRSSGVRSERRKRRINWNLTKGHMRLLSSYSHYF